MKKGIILAGGTGSRLHPLTQAVSKQLLPVYDKPMIYYPLSSLMLGGLRDILIITTAIDQPAFQRLLGDGSQWGIRLSYAVQDEPNGLAEAFLIGEPFLDGEGCALVLGDNLFHGNGLGELIRSATGIDRGARIFVKEAVDLQRYGVVGFDTDGRVTSVEEKPERPKSTWAITGLYFFDERVVDIAKNLTPSDRGELEITDVIHTYLAEGTVDAARLGRGFAWLDTGTFASLVEASEFVRVIEARQQLKIGSPEDVAFEMGYISAADLRALAEPLLKSGYGDSLAALARTGGGVVGGG